MLRVSIEAGVRLASRYRLEERLEQEDGAQTWRAVDEKLSRPVRIHMVPADHARAEQVTAAARSAASIDDGRFLRVLDAAEQDGLVYVVNEWLADARSLSAMLADGPLEPAQAHHLMTEAAQALASAHAYGMAHLRINPDTVLVTEGGQVKIMGLCVEAALYGARSDDPATADARGLGEVLYAALTGRWPAGTAYGLKPAPVEHDRLRTPRQVRAGVPQSLDEVVARTLDLQPRHQQLPLRSPADVAAALTAAPRPRPPVNTNPSVPAVVDRTRVVPRQVAPPPQAWGPSGPARAVRGIVATLLIVGLALLGWQVALVVLNGQGGGGLLGGDTPLEKLSILEVADFDPQPDGNGRENPQQVDLAIDEDPATAWKTVPYFRPALGNLKPGVGLVLDLGGARDVRAVEVTFADAGTSVEVRAARSIVGSMPDSADQYEIVAEKQGAGARETFTLDEPVKTRYLLIWLTELPPSGQGEYQGGIAEVVVRG